MLTNNRSLNKLFKNNYSPSKLLDMSIFDNPYDLKRLLESGIDTAKNVLNVNLKRQQMNAQIKAENPLFPIARDKRKKQFYTYDFPFLEDSEGNENTYILGFCGGYGHAAEIMQKQISELQAKVKEMEAKGIVEESPTIHRQTESL